MLDDMTGVAPTAVLDLEVTDRVRRSRRLGEKRSLVDARALLRAPSNVVPRRAHLRGVLGLPASLLLIDALGMFGAGWLVGTTLKQVFLFGGLVILARLAARVYRRRLRLSVLEDIPRLFNATAAAAGVYLALLTVVSADHPTDEHTLLLPTTFFGVSLLAHGLVMLVARTARRRLPLGQRTLILGAGRVGTALAMTMIEHADLGLRPIGFVDADCHTPLNELPRPLVSTDLSKLSQTILEHRATTVVMAFSTAKEATLVDTVIASHSTGCAVLVVPRLFELHHDGPDVERLRGLPLVRLRPDPTLRPSWLIKRGFDVFVAALCLILASPLLAVTALAILIESGRPVFFLQERVGLDGRRFRLYKFRSMRPADEHESQTQWNIAADPRLSRLGRFIRRASIDEIPQLWNIIKGDMSLVGPRPERPTFVEQFSAQHERYAARHRVPVGLTGLAAVSGLRGDTSISERARYDNYYIANWSLWLDVKIMMLTLREVLLAGGR